MKAGRKIGERDHLKNGQGLRFELPLVAASENNPVPDQAFAIEHEGEVYAYLNRCPHLGVELDWTPGDFFDRERETLVCSTHGARFDPRTGHCISGPCAGQSLYPVEIVETDGQLFICPDKG